MEKQEPMFTLTKPKWTWLKIDSQFKTKIDGKCCKVSLKPTITFEDNLENSRTNVLNQKVIIDTEKSLQYEAEVGWNWHKSSNLPIISIKLEVKQQDSDNLLPLPENLEAKIFATKIIVNSLQRDQIAFLEDVGIRGNSKIQLKDGCGFFSGLRFLSTSYNNQGVKFYLLIVIYSKTEGNRLDNILCSMLSPPIFVDSRKSARDYQEKRFLSFVQLFDPSLFFKEFTKRENKAKSDIQTKIVNNMDGLFNYLTAPNIRHKVKHPIFLNAKFSNVFKIYYNPSNFQNKELTILQIIKKLQRKLIKDIGGQKKNKKMANKNYFKPFIISIIGQCNPHRKSKIMQCLEFLDCRAVQLVQYSYQIPESYRDIAITGDITQAYNDNFDALQQISKKDISARKSREEQAVQLSVRDDFNESDEDQKVHIKEQPQIEKEQQYQSKKTFKKPNNHEKQRIMQRNYNFYRRYKPEHRRMPKIQENYHMLSKMRIDNEMNPVNIVTQNALQPLRVNKDGERIGSAFNLAGIHNHQNNLNQFRQIGPSLSNPMINMPMTLEPPIQSFINVNLMNMRNQSQILEQMNKNQQKPEQIINSQIGPSAIPLPLQSLEISRNIFMQSMSQHPSTVNPNQIIFEKQHLKNQVLSQIDMQNNFLQQMIVDNQIMKQKIQMLFEYTLMQEHQSQSNNEQIRTDKNKQSHIQTNNHDKSNQIQNNLEKQE